MKLVLALASALASVSPVLAADYTLKISSPSPTNDVDPLSSWMSAFEKGVEEASGGRIDVQLYPASQLGPIPATVEGVAMGTIEMTMPVVGFLSKLDPRFQVFDAAGLFDNEQHALKTLSDPSVREMLSQFGKDANVEPLVVLTSGQSFLVAKKPIDTVDAYRGLKLRTGGATALINEPMSALGAAPVAMSLGDALPAIQSGTIDAAVINAAVAVGFKYADVSRYATYVPGNFTVIGGLISKDFLDTIGPELEAVVRNQAEAAKKAYAEKLETAPGILEGAWKKAGGVVDQMSDEEAAAYKSKVSAVVEKVVGEDPQRKADYAVLKAAADANR